jgi:hypothetical protein
VLNKMKHKWTRASFPVLPIYVSSSGWLLDQYSSGWDKFYA